ncbi:hypothetical protein EIP91_006523 [Steccherinum ochraceum]|uniref:amidase n=1 Tax=Steccherinum ochraceum TaxID=92696 RepID=A0A4R0RBF8_9APHY|nr:hypothetical protein EIP91_006523 [Steccherinum ochraceum]
MWFGNWFHWRDCRAKQRERQQRIDNLPAAYHAPITHEDKEILSLTTSEVVSRVHDGKLEPLDVLRAYGKKAIRAQEDTNCLTEIMIEQAEMWAMQCRRDGPLAGMPVSLKDTAGVAGFDSCVGYSRWINRPLQKDSGLVRLLKDAGAIPFVKTNIPITLLSFESNNEIFGIAENPHVKGHAPGGSSGGEAALLAYGGSRIGIGTDVAGSVRVPAHYSGIYTIKASMHRFPKTGNGTSMPGQIGIPAVYSPMTRTLEDLETFWRAIVSVKPWEYDHSCIPLPWRELSLADKKLKFGVVWDDGVVTPSPACQRALDSVIQVLESAGHEIVTVHPPSPVEALQVASQLLLADGGKIVRKPMRWGEWNDLGMVQAFRMFKAPSFIRHLYAWYLRYIRRDAISASLVEGWYEKDVVEYYGLIAKREAYREKWFDMWSREKYDFVLSVPNALPAVPHGGMREGWKACGYSFLFNLLDYSAGVLPVTHVDRTLDGLSDSFSPRNGVEAGSYRMYDADLMHGLPVGVQIVGRRLEEEKVLEGMKLIEALLRKEGKAYELLEVN